MHFCFVGIKKKDWNNVFQTTENTLKGCYVHFTKICHTNYLESSGFDCVKGEDVVYVQYNCQIEIEQSGKVTPFLITELVYWRMFQI